MNDKENCLKYHSNTVPINNEVKCIRTKGQIAKSLSLYQYKNMKNFKMKKNCSSK